jgi:hypothetical protein
MRFFVGIDLGQPFEPTAVAVVESSALRYEMRTTITDDEYSVEPVFFTPDGKETKEHPPLTYSLRHLERLDGPSYPNVVKRVEELQKSLKPTAIAIDATGVGPSAIDLFKRVGIRPKAITIIGGGAVVQEGNDYRVPKRDLITVAQVMLQTERLKIARSIPHAALLIKELKNFRVRIDPNASQDSALDWRQGRNDDLVFALAITLWTAEKNTGIPWGGILMGGRRWSSQYFSSTEEDVW